MTSKLLAALEAATEADLEEIDEQIAKLQKQLDSLKSARSLIDVALHGAKPRLPRGQGKVAMRKAKQAAAGHLTSPLARQAAPIGSSVEPDDEDSDDLGRQIYDLLKERGGMAVAAVAASLKVAPGHIYYHAKKADRFALVAGELRIKK
jgi:hypothetical protein